MEKRQAVISAAVVIVYAVITLTAAFHHEIWADEAQVWQLCRSLNIAELINHLHNEGHPCLFYLLVMPFAKLTSDIIYMQLICWFFMCLAVFMLMYKSPFNLFTKFSVILSAGFLYFLPVIARSYSILPFLTFLAAVLYSKRKEHPLIYAAILFLIANTHIIMFGFAGILFVLFVIETIKAKSLSFKVSWAVMLSGLVCVYLQLHDTTSSNIAIGLSFEDLPFKIYKILSLFFIDLLDYRALLDGAFSAPLIEFPLLVLMIAAFVSILINLFLNSRKLFLILFCGVGFQILLYIFFYSHFVYLTRIYSALIILLFCFWILYAKNDFRNKFKISTKKAASLLLSLFFCLTVYNGINYLLLDYKYNYAGAKEAADYIKNNIDKNSVLLADHEPYMISLVYYLNGEYNLFHPIRNKNIKYIVWDGLTNVNLSKQAWESYIQESQGLNNKNIYIIRSTVQGKFYPAYKDDNFKIVFSSSYFIEGKEGYHIYKYERN